MVLLCHGEHRVHFAVHPRRQQKGTMKNPREGEQFATFSPDRMFRVYTLPAAGLIELEAMNEDGEMVECMLCCTIGVFGYTQGYKERVVNNFRMLLNVWVCQCKCNVDRATAYRSVSSMIELAQAMSEEI
jgi:hypothetical protein